MKPQRDVIGGECIVLSPSLALYGFCILFEERREHAFGIEQHKSRIARASTKKNTRKKCL
jgi:hypothetical protein